MKRVLCVLCLCLLCVGAAALEARAEDAPGVEVDREALLSALYEAEISELREAIDLGLISCEDLTAYYLERIEICNGPYNCFITLCDDALEAARERDRQIAEGTASGLLFGIPVVIKDNMDLAGHYTTNGHPFSESSIAQYDAAVVASLLEQGAVILGKTNMSTDAGDARRSYSEVAGETKNAYNVHLSAGGSSGGSAVAVSLNFAAAALGTDSNSSLRLPAALSGCVSMRATYGLLSVEGITECNMYRDIAGAITRTVYDQALLLDVLTGGEYAYAENLNSKALEGLRIGILAELTYPVEGDELRTQANLDPEVAAAFANAVAELEACGAEVVTVSMPDIFFLSEKTVIHESKYWRDTTHQTFLDLLEEYGVCAVLFPTYLTTPLRSGLDESGKYWGVWGQTFINNCMYLSPAAYLPEITVPIGVHSLGAGIGMEIAAPRGGEQLLLDIAYSYTSAYDHRALPEGAGDLYGDARQGTLREVIDDYLARLEEAQRQPVSGGDSEDPEPSASEPDPQPTVTDPDPLPTPTEGPSAVPEPERGGAWIVLLAAAAAAVILLCILWIRTRRRGA